MDLSERQVLCFLLPDYAIRGVYMVIESAANPLVKQWKKLKDKKYRKQTNEYLIEGVNLCLECIAFRKDLISAAIVTSDKKHLAEGITPLYEVSEKVMETLGDTEAPQGIVLVGRTQDENLDISAMRRIVYLDKVKDPGNVGTIIRSADAFGADAVILSAECADLYNPKTVRATMGSMFHLPVVCENVYLDWLKKLKDADFTIITGSLDTEDTPATVDFVNSKTVICLGNEAHGVSEELVSLGVKKVKIPMPGKAESLNVAIAGSVLLYEAIRGEF